MPGKIKRADEISKDQQVFTQKWYCPGCGRFLGYYAIVWGSVKIKCPNCKEWVHIDISPDN